MSGWSVVSRLLLGLAAGGLAGVTLKPVALRLGGAPAPARFLPLVCTLLGGGVLVCVRASGAAALDFGLAVTLALLAIVDMASLRLPDAITLPLGAAGLAEAIVVHGHLVDRLAGAAAGYGLLAALATIFRWRTGRVGLGAGDAKLFAAAGAWLSWDELPQVLLIACGVGLIVFATRLLRQGPEALRRAIPFGPGLCVGFLVVRLLTAA